MSTRSRILALTIVLASHTMLAGSGGSIYSLIGIGDLRHLPNVRSAGMGYAGYALTSPYSINTLSPATWGKIDRARVEASMLYEGFSSSNATTSRFLARGDVSSAILAFPLSSARGIVIAAGFTPYSKVDYNTYSSSSFVTPTDTMLYSLHYTGTGGISKGQLGLSYAPTRSVSLGASLNYLFGTMERAVIMTPRTSTYYPGTRNEETTMNGPTFTLSALLDQLAATSASRMSTASIAPVYQASYQARASRAWKPWRTSHGVFESSQSLTLMEIFYVLGKSSPSSSMLYPPPAPPNPSFKPSPNGVSRWPSSAGPAAHFALAVQRATPSVPA